MPRAYMVYAPVHHALTALGRWHFFGKSPAIIARNKISRSLYKCLFRAKGSIKVRTRDGFDIVVPLNDQAAASILFERRYSPIQSRAIARIIPLASSFLDIGANLGYFSLFALAQSPQLPVVAVEPNPHLCHLIQASMKLNGMNSGRIVCAAAGAERGRAQMQFDSALSSNSKVVVGDQTVGEWVDVVRVDDLIPEVAGDGFPFVKIDVEGYEAEVLRGSGRAVAEGAVFQCEVSKEQHDNVARLCEAHGYEVFGLSGDRVRLERALKRGGKVDVVLAPSSAVREIIERLR